ncbi:MAG: maleylpyruvate isomerase family mycothiol-dependent enzyme [Ornithinimicrobium sp.]
MNPPTPPHPDSTTAVADRYSRKAEAVAALLDDASPAQWAAESPCEGWTAADVVDHLIETQRDFLAGHELQIPGPDAAQGPAPRWRQHVGRVESLLRDPAVSRRDIEGFFGPTTIGATIEQFYTWDLLVHRWDLAQAMGRDAALTDDELDSIEAALPIFGEALHMPGICGPAVDVGDSQPRLVEVMARLGRDARRPPSTR